MLLLESIRCSACSSLLLVESASGVYSAKCWLRLQMSMRLDQKQEQTHQQHSLGVAAFSPTAVPMSRWGGLRKCVTAIAAQEAPPNIRPILLLLLRDLPDCCWNSMGYIGSVCCFIVSFFVLPSASRNVAPHPNSINSKPAG